ncbi:Asp23/Gls24 family envelope stress response protein [Corynebacterium sp.]|uniref:Asp23/Gls24 family envelope stress response protein n=1 Tax=Corynebacterium sp. TaxID=1720 RepID=UPI0026DA938D|nr:Asp23/Gls24 family envelope stress response protein [Corynebacterium sp.]MDO5077295.1 Asp23/Gls24 family envelope stress response protein [Corynebacterium sp.]
MSERSIPEKTNHDSVIPQTGAQQARAAERQLEHAAEKKLHGPLQTDRGVTTLSDAVVAKVAGIAAREVPGVYDMGNAARRAFSAVSERIPNAQTNVAGGISVEKGEVQTAIDCTIVIEYGYSIVEVGNAIRRNVIEQVESATGLEVIEVNIDVVDVHVPQDDEDSLPSKRDTELQ